MSGDVACYWEKQGADKLCAVHCVNTLLQGPFFSEVDLAKHARELDEQERALLQGAAGESTNVDATGNFSIGVIEAALKTRGYRCYNMQHPQIAEAVRRDPGSEVGFICNSHAREHWFTIRKVKSKWWDLDSLKHSPQAIGDVYLSEFLEATRSEGFTIFVVRDGAAEGPAEARAPELPEPLPGAYAARLHSNQYYLSAAKVEEFKRLGLEKEQREAEEAQRIAGGADGGGGDDDAPSGPSFTVIAPADKRKPQETDWKSLGTGQSLGGSGGGSGAADGEDDAELQAVLRASAVEAAQSSGAAAAAAAAVPEEPAAGSPGLTTIQVRLPSGKRLQRRFLIEEHTVEQVLAWIEQSSLEDGSLGLPVLTSCESYSLMKRVIPGGQLKIERTGGSTKISGEDAGGKSLKDAGFQTGGEALTLQL